MSQDKTTFEISFGYDLDNMTSPIVVDGLEIHSRCNGCGAMSFTVNVPFAGENMRTSIKYALQKIYYRLVFPDGRDEIVYGEHDISVPGGAGDKEYFEINVNTNDGTAVYRDAKGNIVPIEGAIKNTLESNTVYVTDDLAQKYYAHIQNESAKFWLTYSLQDNSNTEGNKIS